MAIASAMGIAQAIGVAFVVRRMNFPKSIAMATHGNNLISTKILPKLNDHDCFIATCEELKRIFPCQLQSRRDRQMKKILHDVRFDIPEDKTQITKFVDTSIDTSKIDAYKVDEPEHDVVGTEETSLTKHGREGTTDKDRCIDDGARCFGGHVPVGDVDDACLPPRSVCPISLDCLGSQTVGTEDEMHIASRVGSKAEGHVLMEKS